jgi:UDP-MurNAc hydroxylase
MRHDLGGGVTINIIAADDCDPELCGKFFGCAPVQAKTGSTQIDSLCVVSDGKSVLVNTNDCPYELAKRILPRIKLDYGTIDLLMTGYSGAGPYPQCFANLTQHQKTEAAAAKKASFLAQGARYISDLTPRYVFPFAGQYTLSGKLGALNDLRGVPEVEEAGAYFASNGGAEVVLLNSGQEFSVSDGTRSAAYQPTDLEAKRRYQSEVLSRRAFPFEDDAMPTDPELQDLLAAAFNRMTAKRIEMGYGSHTVVYIKLREGHFARIPLDGTPLAIVEGPAEDSRIAFNLDSRLLKRILSGPRFAHWNNAEIGSHIEYDRHPNVFDRGLHHVMNFFHA